MTPPTDRDRELMRGIVHLCGSSSLEDTILHALASTREAEHVRCIALARGVCTKLDAAGRGGEASARSEGARAVLKALTGEDVPVEAQRAVEALGS